MKILVQSGQNIHRRGANHYYVVFREINFNHTPKKKKQRIVMYIKHLMIIYGFKTAMSFKSNLEVSLKTNY